MTDQQLREVRDYANANRQHVILNDTHILIDNLAEHTLDLADEVERLQKEVHGHEQSLLHDTYSEFTTTREIKRLRETLEQIAYGPITGDAKGINYKRDHERWRNLATKALEGGK